MSRYGVTGPQWVKSTDLHETSEWSDVIIFLYLLTPSRLWNICPLWTVIQLFMSQLPAIWPRNVSQIIQITNVMDQLDGFQWHISIFGMSRICIKRLTHWGRYKMAAICQTTPSNAFSWMEMLGFRLRFHWNLFLRIQSTIFQQWFR